MYCLAKMWFLLMTSRITIQVRILARVCGSYMNIYIYMPTSMSTCPDRKGKITDKNRRLYNLIADINS